ncbi:pantoate--beta-alanine ligase [Virgibacillus siamensis]|uniref:pantoate--beta-alanine ligase n=1 Tax=Virgibacillus siamensis TaxID=480071 RepID=UPI000985C6AB|nr:pantoate--beta-alanine ligase [Virgibacillus siamensis]
MQIIHSVNEMQKKMLTLGKENMIGFVATMGYFHEGHISLMKESVKDNDITVTSIFVNPLQFGENEDLDRYPRDLENDRKKAEAAGVDFLFIPQADDMYPSKMTLEIIAKERTNVMCGKSRPGHFEGVATVLIKLFHIVRPDKTYFGIKDAQQAAVVEALIKDLNFPIELITLPIVREADGLAKSSRNVNLNEQERAEAIWLKKALEHGRKIVVDGELNPAKMVKEATKIIHDKTSGSVDYVEVLSYPELKPVTENDNSIIIAAAVNFNQARLIDNLIFDREGKLLR